MTALFRGYWSHGTRHSCVDLLASPMSTFGEREFSITPVRGVRTFRVLRDGRLIGHTGYEWSDGINTAVCNYELARFHRGTRAFRWFLRGRSLHQSTEHDMATCSCGFYAYHDGVSDFGVQGEWLAHGVIEGFGKTTIGKRGFRTEKARLLAISPPTRSMTPHPDRRHRLRGWIVALVVVSIVFSFVGDTSLLQSAGVDPAFADGLRPKAELVQWVTSISALVLAVFGMVADRYGPARSRAFRREASAPASVPDAETAAIVAAVREHYPSVAVLPSLGNLLTEYPPDPIPNA